MTSPRSPGQDQPVGDSEPADTERDVACPPDSSTVQSSTVQSSSVQSSVVQDGAVQDGAVQGAADPDPAEPKLAHVNPVSRPDAINQVRASDAEREDVVRRLRDAVGDGRITLDEFDERVGLALAAVTRGELEPLSADLAAAAPAATSVTRITTVFGDDERTGAWRCTGKIHVMSVCGDIKIDLRRAYVETAEIVITGFMILGDLKLLVPPGTEIELGGTSILSDVKNRSVGEPPTPGMPRVRLEITMLMGDVVVDSQERKRRSLFKSADPD